MTPIDIIGIGIGVGIASAITVLGVIAALQAWNYLPVKETWEAGHVYKTGDIDVVIEEGADHDCRFD